MLIKPDGVQRSLIGDIITRFERVGLKLVAMKFVAATEEQCWKHYNKDEAWFLKKGIKIVENLKEMKRPVEKEAIEYGKDIIGAVVKYMVAGPIVAMVWEGNSSVAIIKKLVGATDPDMSVVGTIRGDYALDSYYMCDFDNGRAIRNLVHCTDNPAEYTHEMSIWFEDKEVISYRLIQDEILYDVNLDGILE